MWKIDCRYNLVSSFCFITYNFTINSGCSPAPSLMQNPMESVTTFRENKGTSTHTNDVKSRRFDAIIHECKRSIKKKQQQLKRVKRNELSKLIVKLRQKLLSNTSQILTEDEKQKKTNDQVLQVLNRSLDQNELLLRLVDRLTMPQPVQHNSTHNLNIEGIIKLILAIMLLWTLNLLCRTE